MITVKRGVKNNSKYSKGEIPQKLMVNKEDIVIFSDFSLWINFSTLKCHDCGDIKLEKVKSARKYKMIDYDPFFLLFSDDVKILEEEEKQAMRKWCDLVYIQFQL